MAIEFISDLVGSTVNEFIDLALAIVTLLMVWYVIKFFIVEPKGKDESSGELGDLIKKKWGEKKEEKKKNAEAKERERLLEPVKGFILRVEQNADKASDALSHHNASGLRSLENGISRIEDNLRSAKRVLRALKLKTKTPQRDYISGLLTYTETIDQVVKENLRLSLPANPAGINWGVFMGTIRPVVSAITTRCGLLITSIDKFIDEDKLEVPR